MEGGGRCLEHCISIESVLLLPQYLKANSDLAAIQRFSTSSFQSSNSHGYIHLDLQVDSTLSTAPIVATCVAFFEPKAIAPPFSCRCRYSVGSLMRWYSRYGGYKSAGLRSR